MNALELRRRTLGKGVYKKTVEGNPAIAQGSLARRSPGITMQGWTEQAQYEGKNLFSGSVLEGKYPTDNMNVYEDKTTTNIFDKPIEILPNTNYFISIDGKRLEGNVFIYNENGQKIADYYNGKFLSPGLSKYVVTAASSTLMKVDSKIQIEVGDTATEYEPYTGGQPSPSPDYPQEIISAGKYDEGTGKWKYEVKLTGANLFDISKVLPVTSGDNKIEIDGNKIIVTNGAGSNGVYPYAPNTLRDYCPEIEAGNEYTFTFITTGSMKKIYLTSAATAWVSGQSKVVTEEMLNSSIAFYASGLSTSAEITNIMFNKGSTALPYEPYRTPQTVTLTSDRPLTKWDKLEKRNGQWGWVYKSGSYTVTGEEFFTSSTASYHGEQTSDAWLLVDNMFSKVWIPSDDPGGYCEKLSWSQAIWEKDGNVGFTYNSKQIHIRLNNADVGITSEDTLTDIANKIKEYVGQQYQEGNPFVFWYETAEETFVPLSESEQEAMNELYTFRPTTVLSNDCDCNMSLTYKTKKSLEVTT